MEFILTLSLYNNISQQETITIIVEISKDKRRVRNMYSKRCKGIQELISTNKLEEEHQPGRKDVIAKQVISGSFKRKKT